MEFASNSIESNGRVVPGISGKNCFGRAKLDMVEDKLGRLKGLTQAGQQVWFYTDHHSDIPLLELCSHPVAVNPTTRLKDWASNYLWARIVRWNSRTVTTLKGTQVKSVDDH